MNGNPGIPIRTDAMRAAIILKVQAGVPKSVAATSLGCSKPAFFQWLKDDPSFRDDLDRAQADWGARLVERAMEIATTAPLKDSVSMVQFLMERRLFQFFARKERTTGLGLTGDPDDAVLDASTTPIPGNVTEADLDALLRDAETIADIIRTAKAGAGTPGETR